MPLALLALAIGAFGIGTTEFVIMGLLPEVAATYGVSIPTAGFLVTGYALGVVLGAPLMTVLGTRIPRKRMLMLLMGLFIVGNVVSALAPAFGVMLAGRVVASLAHGAFFGIGAVVAAELVAPEKKAGAIAMMFTGLTVANVVGVPLGTLVGQHLGWRVTFLIVASLGLLGLLGIARLVPDLPRPEGVRIRHELAAFRNVQVLLAMGMTVLGFGGVFAAITYITPMMTNVAGFADTSVTWLLVLLGLGMVAGNLVGGRFADRALMPMLYTSLGALAVVLAAFTLTAHTRAAPPSPSSSSGPSASPPCRRCRSGSSTRPPAPDPGLRRQHRRLQPRQRPRRLARRPRHRRRTRLDRPELGRRGTGRLRPGPRPGLRRAGTPYGDPRGRRRRQPGHRGRRPDGDRSRRTGPPLIHRPPHTTPLHPTPPPLTSQETRMSTPTRTRTAVAPLTTADAETLVAAATAAAEAAGVAVSVTVLDAGGHPLAFRRDDRAVLISGETSTRKAFTALQLDAPTADLVDAVQPGGPFHTLPTALDRPLLFIAGGLPVHRDGRLVGAIGVGGGAPAQDHGFAESALGALA